jgi:trimethylamine--corrinoid protein Co-methyltransferase
LKRSLHAGKRQSGGFSLNVFSEDELHEIHLATLEILETAGVFVENEEALEIFGGGGAVVDRKNKIVKFPPYLVEDAVRSAPPKLVLAGRNPKNDVVVEGNRVNFTSYGQGIRVIDPYTGQRRASTKVDVEASALLADYLEDMDVYERAVGSLDVSQEVTDIHNAEAILTHTTKHAFMGAGNGKRARRILDMVAAIVGDKEKHRERPIVTFNTCPVSPLRLVNDFCEIVVVGAQTGTPVNIIDMAMSGGSGPITLAGTLVGMNAEVLSGIVLSQLTRKGAPVIYGSSTTCMDLRSGTSPIGSPEIAMISAAAAQLAHFYEVPSFVAGGAADSKVSDAQAAHEKTLTALIPALAGANIIFGLGMLEMGITFSFGQLVMDCEFARMIKHAVRGIPVNDETLAVDVIGEVGPFKDFLSHDHTLTHMRATQSQPKLIDRRTREDWEKSGGTDLSQRAAEQARRILETHRPEPLPEGVLGQIRSIVDEAEAEFGVSKRKK